MDESRIAELIDPSPSVDRRIVLVVGVALLPWLTILVAHYLGNGESATGFIQYDQPYYVANGRAVFERGNGLLYPNPSDADPDAPAIYFHWLPWILGAAVTHLSMAPGVAYTLLTVVMLPVFGYLTWQLVRRRTTHHRLSITVLALWGGGMVSVIGILKGLVTGIPLDEAVFEFDPTEGLWFLNWGRNTVYGIEITYHCFVAATWWMVLQRRHTLALMFAGCLALTHPWSGIELLLTLNAWFLLETIRNRTGANLRTLGCSILLLCLLLGYYKVWLPQFPAHATLQKNWSMNWNLEWSTVLYAYGPVAYLAFLQLRRSAFRLNREEQFLLIAAAVALGLSLHDRVLSQPVQPIHFTRGYIWMPLFLIAVPQLQRFLVDISHHRHRRIAVAVLVFFACFDNIAFTVTHSVWQYRGEEGFFLAAEDWNVLASLNECAQDRVVFCESLQLNYLMPTYIPVRPWMCHKFNTPDFIPRDRVLARAIAGDSIDPDLLSAKIDVLVLSRQRRTDALEQHQDWVLDEGQNAKWQIWQRRVDAPVRRAAL